MSCWAPGIAQIHVMRALKHTGTTRKCYKCAYRMSLSTLRAPPNDWHPSWNPSILSLPVTLSLSLSVSLSLSLPSVTETHVCHVVQFAQVRKVKPSLACISEACLTAASSGLRWSSSLAPALIDLALANKLVPKIAPCPMESNTKKPA